MRVPVLKQKLIILGQHEAQSLPAAFLAEWNVISITGRAMRMPVYFPTAQKLCSLCFDDVEEDNPETGHFAATERDVSKAIAFAREVGDKHLLIHCYAGISRSTAIAWIIIWDKLKARPDAVRLSFEIVRQVRPVLMPNRHILRLGIKALAPVEAQATLMREFQECLKELGNDKAL